jgi:hypothetical protein
MEELPTILELEYAGLHCGVFQSLRDLAGVNVFSAYENAACDATGECVTFQALQYPGICSPCSRLARLTIMLTHSTFSWLSFTGPEDL